MPTSLPRSQESYRYYNMVTMLVFPAIVAEKFKHMRVREVMMQQDDARCHTQKKKDGFEAMTQKTEVKRRRRQAPPSYQGRDTAGAESRR